MTGWEALEVARKDENIKIKKSDWGEWYLCFEEGKLILVPSDLFLEIEDFNNDWVVEEAESDVF